MSIWTKDPLLTKVQYLDNYLDISVGKGDEFSHHSRLISHVRAPSFLKRPEVLNFDYPYL